MSTVTNFPTKQRPFAPYIFNIGDSFTTEDGVRVHVMGARETDKGRQLLYSGGGTRIWAAETAFVRVQ